MHRLATIVHSITDDDDDDGRQTDATQHCSISANGDNGRLKILRISRDIIRHLSTTQKYLYFAVNSDVQHCTMSTLSAFMFVAAFFHRFYRAMHFSAKRGIAIACRLSVRLSVCL